MRCNAELHIADDYGDNHATIKCQREEGHDGSHEERFRKETMVVITFWCDDRDDRDERDE